MTQRQNYQEGLNFVGAIAINSNPKIHLDGGPTFDEMVIETNLAAGEFSLIVEVEGERRVEISGTQMNQRQAYDQKTDTSGQFVFSFADAVAKSSLGENLTSLCTLPGQRIVVELAIGGTIVAGTPVATFYAETSDHRPEEFRLYVLPEDIQVTKIGENPFANFRRARTPATQFIRRVFAYGAITHLSIEQDRRSRFGKGELSKAVNDARLLRNGKTVPAACFVYDPVLKGNAYNDLFDTFSVEYLRFKYTTSDAVDITALTEYVTDMRPKAA